MGAGPPPGCLPTGKVTGMLEGVPSGVSARHSEPCRSTSYLCPVTLTSLLPKPD
jgi:hypothetical protein